MKCDAATRAWTVGDKVLEAPLACVSADKVGKKEEEATTEDGTDKKEDEGGSNCEEFSVSREKNFKKS